MKRLKSIILFSVYTIVILALADFIYQICNGQSCLEYQGSKIPLSLEEYQDSGIPTIMDQLRHRVLLQPFNLFSFLIFVCAIFHTFFAHKLTVLSKRLRDWNIQQNKEIVDSFGVEILRFLGEIEVVFAIWVIPLMIGMANFYSWPETITYLDSLSYIEPVFVVVIMALASTAPIVNLAEDCLNLFARLGKGSVQAWWWAILTIGPLSGSLITEPGAMTISALLLARHFYELKPSKMLSYATLGLLFTNISVGGVFTSFAAPPVLMVSAAWKWGTWHMFTNFGWKALLGILIANSVYYYIFRKELAELNQRQNTEVKVHEGVKKKERKIPFWISLVHIVFLAWTVVHSHHPVVFVGSFMLFLGFYQATLPYQKVLSLKPPILVGLFLAGLVVHGSLQGWWIEPLLGRASSGALLVLSTFLTSFNDNAEITFLATLIPSFTDSMKYAVLAGAVTGGGLTVIANAPNPSGQAILGKYFDQGVSAVNLLGAAIFPAAVMGICFYLLQWV